MELQGVLLWQSESSYKSFSWISCVADSYRQVLTSLMPDKATIQTRLFLSTLK